MNTSFFLQKSFVEDLKSLDYVENSSTMAKRPKLGSKLFTLTVKPFLSTDGETNALWQSDRHNEINSTKKVYPSVHNIYLSIYPRKCLKLFSSKIL